MPLSTRIANLILACWLTCGLATAVVTLALFTRIWS